MRKSRWRLNRSKFPFTYDKEIQNETSKQWDHIIQLPLGEKSRIDCSKKCNGDVLMIEGAPQICDLVICSKCGRECSSRYSRR